MPLSMSHSSIDAYARALNALLAIIDKAAAHAETKKFDSSIYGPMRLRPDMFSFARQVQVACEQAKIGASRLAGVEPPKWDDPETTLASLKARVHKTLAYLAGLDRQAVDASADREIVFPLGADKMKMPGAEYLVQFSMPNFYFHVTAAYAILRYAGVELEKRDYRGHMEMTPA